MLGFLFTGTGFAQEIQMTKPSSAGELPEYTKDDGEWIKYYQTVNDNALGLGGTEVVNWYAAIRWMPADLEAYEGYSVTKIRVFMNDAPETGAVVIWQGTMAEPVIYVTQAMSTVVELDWVEVELFDPYMIDTSQELWIGWEIGDPGDGVFPAAFDTENPVEGVSDLLQFGENPWANAVDYGFDVAWNIEAFVVPGGDPDPTYTVTFDVQDEEGAGIDNASIVLGPFSGGPGEYVFEGAPVGTHEYTVTAPGYTTVTGEVEVIDEDVTVAIVMEEGEIVYHSVTFNVDMTGVEGFDPAEHDVFLTGSITDWAEPGSEGSVQMAIVPPAAKEAPYTFYENFEGYDDFTTDLSPWITLQLSEGPTWGSADFAFPGEGEEFAWMAFNPSATDPPIDEENPPVDGSKMAMAVQYTDVNDDKWLISPEFSANETSMLSFHARSYTAAYGLERIRVLVSTSGEDPGNFIPISEGAFIEVPTEWTEYNFSLADYAGETFRFAINYMSEDAFIFFLDAISLTADVDPGDEWIYTATLDEVAEGTIAYKYFSNAIDEGWDGGEWAGDPNREAEITEDTILDDVWAVYGNDDTSVTEVSIEEINVYPNPASSNLTVTSSSMMLNVTVYDITGRAVMNADINDNTHVFDVTSLRNGLYIMQVKTVDGIEGLRFHVVK
jgi:hypothetical protein